ncbi:cell wall hydrolase [Amaricoccus solimangrovi]|uniref:Cell wall hydrolase n=1 Tax=Amaricoccus solimangrovi TaxID=2589815 RepID=A0A501WX28_9RHOB|nr:cell wall hydrolase [Amaricoccus solimangrovi]TPE51501.1 cell wall hydrolase [Amaricoccus solimangrovi]
MRLFDHSLRATLALALAGALAAPALAADPAVSTRNAPRSSEMSCLAEAVYFEAGGTGTKGEAAVAHVIVNRAESPKFPGTVCGVVRQGCQFSYRCDGKSDALANAERRERAYAAARAALSGAPDITKGALFFHAASAKPGWFASRDRVGRIGGNVFYR